MAIRRLSGDVPRVEWDARSNSIVEGASLAVNEIIDEGLVSVVKKNTKDKKFVDAMEGAMADLKDVVRQIISQCVVAAEQLGQDKFRNKGIPKKLGVEELKND